MHGRKKNMIRQLCLLLVTKLDAAAPGGASSNRRRGVDGHGPRRSAQPPFQPRVIPHPIGRALERAPGLLGSRERERKRAGRGEPKIKGGSRPGLRLQRLDCNAEQNIHHNFLFSLSQFAISAVFRYHRFLSVFLATTTPNDPNWGHKHFFRFNLERTVPSMFLKHALVTLRSSPSCCGSY